MGTSWIKEDLYSGGDGGGEGVYSSNTRAVSMDSHGSDMSSGK